MDGWMDEWMDGWLDGELDKKHFFSLGFSSLANHGYQLSRHFYYLPTNNP
jgi:hypothetical protein